MSKTTIDFDALINKKVVVETHEGSLMSGKLTKVNWFQTDLGGKVVNTPKSIELNNDASEFWDWPLVKRIHLA